MVLKSSPRWGRCHEVTDEGKINVKIGIKYPSFVTAYAVPPSPRGEGFKTFPSNLRFSDFSFGDGKKVVQTDLRKMK